MSQYIDAAHEAIAAIKGRGREVLFVGGTPLYLKSLLRGVFQGPAADWDFRASIERELTKLPLAALHERLQVIDPLLAARLHPHDKRRIIRGLEVFKLTGQRLSHLQTQFDESQPPSEARVFVLSWPRAELHARIDARVEQMFAAGLVDEVRSLLAKYGSLSRTAMQAVGYREVIDFLQSRDGHRGEAVVGSRGESSGVRHPEGTRGSGVSEPGIESMSECINRVKARTRQFARRQETWFRSLSECTLVPMAAGFEPGQTAQAITELAGQSRTSHPSR